LIPVWDVLVEFTKCSHCSDNQCCCVSEVCVLLCVFDHVELELVVGLHCHSALSQAALYLFHVFGGGFRLLLSSDGELLQVLRHVGWERLFWNLQVLMSQKLKLSSSSDGMKQRHITSTIWDYMMEVTVL